MENEGAGRRHSLSRQHAPRIEFLGHFEIPRPIPDLLKHLAVTGPAINALLRRRPFDLVFA